MDRTSAVSVGRFENSSVLCASFSVPRFRQSVHPDNRRIQGHSGGHTVAGPGRVERPISCASRQLNLAESNYSASEAEMLAVTWGTRHYRCYLFGKRFIIRTDHAALRYLHNFADNYSRLFRWNLRLPEFDFAAEHRPGTQIRNAVALSKSVQSIAHDRDLSREEVKTEQAKEKFCQSLDVGRARGKSEYFADEDGVIYCRRKNGEHQLVLPSSIAMKVIALNHKPVTVSHPGSSHTFDILCLRFCWPRMQRNLDEYVKNFHECERLNLGMNLKHPRRRFGTNGAI